MSPETMRQLGATMWNSNPAVVRNLISQRADSTIAFVFLALGLVLSVWLPHIPDRPSPLKSWLSGMILFVGTLLILYFAGNYTSRTMERVLAKKVEGAQSR